LYARYSQSLPPTEAQNTVHDSLLVHVSYAGILFFILCVATLFIKGLESGTFDAVPQFFFLSAFFGLYGLHNSWSDILHIKSWKTFRPKLRLGTKLLGVNLLLVVSVIALILINNYMV
jgi:hypothetical protein